MTLGQYDPELIFGFTSQQMAMLASKLVSDRILDIWDPSTSIFQHSKDSLPPFMSFKLDQCLLIETLKIGKAPKGPPFETKKNFCPLFNRTSGRATTLSTKSNFGLPWIFLAEMKDLGELINIFENFQNPSVRAWWNLRSKIQKMRKNCMKGEQVWFGTARIWTWAYSSRVRCLSHHGQPAT